MASRSISLGDRDYEIKPINIVQAVRLTNLVRTYVARSSEVVRAFTIQEEGDDAYAKLSRGFAAVNKHIPPDEFERDFLACISLVTGIDQETLETIPFEDLVLNIEDILELSRVKAVIQKAFGLVPSAQQAAGAIEFPSRNGRTSRARK